MPTDDPAHPWYERPDAIQELTEVREVSCALSVVVDFNELFSDLGEARTFELIGKLKDLLP